MDYEKDFDERNINKVNPRTAKKTVFATGIGMLWNGSILDFIPI